MSNEKKIYIGISIIAIVGLVVGISYAIWTFNIAQEGINTITSGCLRLTLTDETEAINLTKTQPITDTEASNLEPYTFKIENTCNNEVSYNISLEMMDVTNRLLTKYVAISVDNKAKSILSNLEETETTYNKGDYTPVEGRMLVSGTLKANTSISHSIRLWMDESVTSSDDAMDKTFLGKVVLNATIKPQSNVLTDVITNLAETNPEELAYDGTEDNNLRYIGANPNNYVKFNNEIWRIIGVMNNITDSEGNVGSHIKIIRNESIGDYSWDNKASGVGSSTSNDGSNDWTDSALMNVLNNGAYYNRTSGNCPSGQYGATTACDFSSNGLSEETKNMIASVVWKLGGHSTYQVAASVIYGYERESSVYSGRPTEWTGRIGLMYPSDYGYAVGGSVRERCLRTDLDRYNANYCNTNDWLYKSGTYQCSLMPSSGFSYNVFGVNSRGSVSFATMSSINAVHPVLYLESNVEIIGGDGTQENAFELKNMS